MLQQKHLVQLQMLGDSRWFELTNDRFVGPIQRDNRRWFAQNLAPLQLKARDWVRHDRSPRLLLSVREWWRTRRWRRAHKLRDEDLEFWQRSVRRLWRGRFIPFGLGVLAVLLAVLLGYEIVREMHAADAHNQQRMLVKLGFAKQMALERSLDHALIEGALAAKEVAELPQSNFPSDLLRRLLGRPPERSARERLAFWVRGSLMSVLRAASDVRSMVIHENHRLNALAARPTDGLFAYGGTGGKVRFYLAGTSDIPGTSDDRLCESEDQCPFTCVQPAGNAAGAGLRRRNGRSLVDFRLEASRSMAGSQGQEDSSPGIRSRRHRRGFGGRRRQHHQTHAAQSGWRPQARSDERAIGT